MNQLQHKSDCPGRFGGICTCNPPSDRPVWVNEILQRLERIERLLERHEAKTQPD